MSIHCHYVDDLHPNLTDKWTLNVMAARVWTTYNPNNNRILSNYLIIVVERGCVYKIHMFTVNEYGQTKYRPLYSKIFVQFGFKTSVQPSSIKPELFDRCVFKFVPFPDLQQRIGNDTYLSDVVGVLQKWDPLQDSVGKNQGCNPQLCKIVIVDTRLIGPVSFTLGTESDELKVTSITDIYKHLADGVTLGTRFIVHGMVIAIDLDKDWKYVQCTKCFKKATLDGNRYYCQHCAKHVMNPRLTYKLVITIRDNGDDIDCVLFNSEATPLLGIAVKELFNKTITEGANDPNWIVDYLIDHLCTQWVVLQIKIDKYNLAPTYVRRYTATKYNGHDVNDMNKHIRISSSTRSIQKIVYSDLSISSPDNYCDTTDYAIHDENLGSTISEYEEKPMDELILKPAATHICTNEVPYAPNTSTNDFIGNDPNKGKAIVDVEPVVVETHVNDFTHDESSSLAELASDVNKDVCPPSSLIIEPDEMPTRGDEDKMMISVDEAAINQHVDIMQDD
ncbi:nucleic acid-binding, OB-fold protein [Tanacetum coccineum]